MVRVGERYCSVEAYGHVVVVCTEDLSPVSKPPTGSDDEWWDDVKGRLGS